MNGSRFTEVQTIGILCEQDAGGSTPDLFVGRPGSPVAGRS